MIESFFSLSRKDQSELLDNAVDFDVVLEQCLVLEKSVNCAFRSA